MWESKKELDIRNRRKCQKIKLSLEIKSMKREQNAIIKEGKLKIMLTHLKNQ